MTIFMQCLLYSPVVVLVACVVKDELNYRATRNTRRK